MKILAVITARGGSKGIPRKNIKLLGGKPLLRYTAEAALLARSVTHTVLTTDDSEIAGVGRACGLDVPFLRPPELALDRTPSLPVVQHAVQWFEERGQHFDAVATLQPTSPFRRSEDIDACVELMCGTGSDSVVSVLRVPDEFNPHWVFWRNPSGFLDLATGEAAIIPRRQDLPPAYHRDGSVYLTRRDVLMVSNSLYGTKIAGYEMDGRRSVNIDRPEDWVRAETMIAEGVV